MKSAQSVSVLVLVGTGSNYETKNINGISHFLEHMFFKGTKKRPTKLEIAETLDMVGGMYNAFTGNEYTGYWAKVASKDFDLALDWVSDIFLNSKIAQKEIEKERGVIIEEINMYLDTPMARIDDFWEALLYGDQPAGRTTLGTKEIVNKLKRQDFLNYLKNHYTAKNTIICIAGNIDNETAKKKAWQHFKNIRTNVSKLKSKTIERQTQPECSINFKDTDQTHLYLGVRGYDLFNPKRYAQAISASILGGFMSSRLFLSVREEKGLAYYIRTSAETALDSGYLATSAGVRNDKVEEAIKLILKEYKSLKDKKISEKELKKAKDYSKGVLTLSLESSDNMASSCATQELFKGEILTLKQRIKKIDEVSRDDIFQVANDIFKPEKLNLALIGPFKDKEAFSKLLKL